MSRLVLRIGLLLIALSIVGSAHRVYGDEGTCAPKNAGYWGQVVARDCQLLIQFAPIVHRNDVDLTVTLVSGENRTYQGCAEGLDVSCRDYRVHSIDLRSQVVLVLDMGANSDSLVTRMIDRSNGDELVLDDIPHISPDGKHWAVVGNWISESGDLQLLGRSAGHLAVLASGKHDLCAFEKWESSGPAFFVVCKEASGYPEYREEPVTNGGMSEKRTGRLFNDSEFDEIETRAFAND